ncbi:hypothetical protein [Streptomyces sp. NPDC020362]|uniref:ATP-binding protein n=1 Tax=unclassified Streptomyces TaxID=2593676 RepID=UPI00340D3256
MIWASQGSLITRLYGWPSVCPATRRGARLAHLLTERHLADRGVPFEEAVQVVAELAADAVLHGRVRGRDFRLGLKLRDDGTLRIEVTDALGDRIPCAQDPAAQDSETGRGLLIVAAHAHRWGVDLTPANTKTIWAELTPGRGGAGPGGSRRKRPKNRGKNRTHPHRPRRSLAGVNMPNAAGVAGQLWCNVGEGNPQTCIGPRRDWHPSARA